jgi:hypothetical protein
MISESSPEGVEEVVVLDELNAQPLAALHEGAEIVLELLTYLSRSAIRKWLQALVMRMPSVNGRVPMPPRSEWRQAWDGT